MKTLIRFCVFAVLFVCVLGTGSPLIFDASQSTYCKACIDVEISNETDHLMIVTLGLTKLHEYYGSSSRLARVMRPDDMTFTEISHGTSYKLSGNLRDVLHNYSFCGHIDAIFTLPHTGDILCSYNISDWMALSNDIHIETHHAAVDLHDKSTTYLVNSPSSNPQYSHKILMPLSAPILVDAKFFQINPVGRDSESSYAVQALFSFSMRQATSVSASSASSASGSMTAITTSFNMTSGTTSGSGGSNKDNGTKVIWIIFLVASILIFLYAVASLIACIRGGTDMWCNMSSCVFTCLCVIILEALQ